MTQSTRTFRIFISSTFSDMKEERNALQRDVFPKLRELCMQHGCRFQAIDLRWGVSDEAALDQQTVKICLEEIDRCQKVTPRPNFIVLLGDRYGWQPLPYEIPATEFEEIERRVSDTENNALLKYWYKRDDNAVPPVYCLLPRVEKYAQLSEWEIAEHRLRYILLNAVKGMHLSDDQRQKYVASATEQEIVHGALRAPNPQQHVFCFFRTIKELPKDKSTKDFMDSDREGNPDDNARKQQNDLKKRLDKLLSENVFKYEAQWTVNGMTAGQVGKMCADAYQSLSSVILDEIKAINAIDSLEKEVIEHKEFGKTRAKFFIGRTAVLRKLTDYIEGDDPHPLAIVGESGSGKSALMAQACQAVFQAHPRKQIIFRFIGATPGSSDGRALLESLCRQISRSYEADESAIPTDYKELAQELPKRLAAATQANPLILFLDALDQMSAVDQARHLAWLPAALPRHVRVIVSTGPGECLSALDKKLPEANRVKLERMPLTEGAELINLWFREAGRKLQEHQLKTVLNKFAGCGLPLYLKLVFEESRKWKSYTAKTELGPDIPRLIDGLFERLSAGSNHGGLLVARSLGYLAATKNGLSEDEMLDVLSLDEEVFQDFIQRSHHEPPERKLPVVVWSRLYFDLEPYLAERAVDGTILMSFYHRQVAEAAKKRYLDSEDKFHAHRKLAEYFRRKSDPAGNSTWMVLFPRGLDELPYHLFRSGQMEQLDDLLTNIPYLSQRSRLCDVYDLIRDYDDLDGADGLESGTWKDYRIFLKKNAHLLLSRHPEIFFSLIYNEGFPAARKQAQALADSGSWKRPWFKFESLWRPTYGQTEPKSGECLEIVSQIESGNNCGWGIGSKLACLSQGLGRIGVADVETGRLLPVLISSRRSRALRMAVDSNDRFLAIAHEDGWIELFRIDLNADGGYLGHALMDSFPYLVPAFEAPVLLFAGGRLWYQDATEQIVALALPGLPAIVLKHIPACPAPRAELSGVAMTGETLVLTWRCGRDTELYVTGSDGSEQIEIFTNADVTAIVPCGRDRVALALSDYRLLVCQVVPRIVECAAVRTTESVHGIAWCEEKAEELCWVTSRRAYTWHMDSAHTPIAVDCPDSLSVPFQGLMVRPGDYWFVPTMDALITLRYHNKQMTPAPILGEFRQIFAAGEAYVGIQRATEKYWFVDGNRHCTVEIPFGPPLNGRADYHAAAAAMLALPWDGNGFLLEAEGETVSSVSCFNRGVYSIAADPVEGFWVADRAGHIHHFRQGGSEVKAVTYPDVISQTQVRCWPGSPDWLIWEGVLQKDHQRSVGTTLIFFRIRRDESGPQLERVGERIFSPEDGELETYVFLPQRNEFYFKFLFQVRAGTVEDFLSGNERKLPMPFGYSRCRAAAAAPLDQGVYLLTLDGQLLLIDPITGILRGFYVGSVPFNQMANHCLAGGGLVVAGGGLVFNCTFQEDLV